MEIPTRKITVILSVFGMLILILDAKTAYNAAAEGIQICLYTIIPSLFPFFFMAQILNRSLLNKSLPLLSSVGRFCRIPKGAEGLFLTGILGGYPVGAKSIREAYDCGILSKKDADRMLGFCNNPGPAFLFGISGALFTSPFIPFVIYLIVIFSAVLTGYFLPGEGQSECPPMKPIPASPLKNAMMATMSVCGWVILFKILLAFLSRWLFWLLPSQMVLVLSGMMELTNGCMALANLSNDFVKFILLTAFMVFGGLCITVQTGSVTGGLSLKGYFTGKLLQTYIASVLALFISHILFPGNVSPITTIAFLLPIFPVIKIKNSAGKPKVYGV